MGMWAIGPLTDPAQLRTALDEALAEIDAGRPALIHVLTPRG
jgi:hypothetical protein